MRDVILTLFFVGVLPFALRSTWIGILLWTWISLMSPHKLTFGFANQAPFALVAAVVTLISLFTSRDKLRLPADPTVVALVAFLLWMCCTTFFGFYPERSFDILIDVFKVQLMTLVAVMCIRQRKHIEAFVWVIVVSIGFYGFKGGVFTIASGGSSRVWGPPDTYLNGNNEIGLALTMVIPLMNYLRVVSPNKWIRRGLLLTMLLSAASALGTQSRGAFLAIAAMGLVLWWRSQRQLVGGVVLAIVTVLFLAFMPQSWEDRMRTIGTYQEDSSAMSRIVVWQTAVNIANDRPTGGGFLVETREVFQKYSSNPDWVITAHSIYFQALGEQGWVGLFLFLAIGGTTFWSTTRIRKRCKGRPELAWLHELAGMIQVSMVGYAVGGSFLSLAYLDLAYNVAVVVIACKYWLRDERWKSEPLGLFGAGNPVKRLQAKAA
jgi:putative inorganic carbon (HCO3(-)) transporter